MLRSAKIINVDDANANNEKLIRCYAASLNAGARALSAVKFDGISGVHWQNEVIPVAMPACTGVHYSATYHNRNTDNLFSALNTHAGEACMVSGKRCLTRRVNRG
jgi:hypothetical protein